MNKESTRDVRKYFELKESKFIICYNLWSETKTVSSGQFIALNTIIRKEKGPKSVT